MIIKRNREKLASEEFKGKYRALVEGNQISFNYCGSGAYWTPFVLARWSMLCLVLVLLRDFCVA